MDKKMPKEMETGRGGGIWGVTELNLGYEMGETPIVYYTYTHYGNLG